MSKTITIKDFIIEIPDEEQCNAACETCKEATGLRTLKPNNFINNFVEINQMYGFQVGFNDCEVCDE